MESQEESKDTPTRLSPEWHDYVMSLFKEHELFDGYPTTAGLRRVCEILIGKIVKSGPSKVFPVEGNGIGRATVIYSISVKDFDGDILEYSDVADAWEGNTDDLFFAHAPATASTKAEGRAIRKLLKLRTLAAEELCKKDVSKYIATEERGSTSEERISQDQVNFINMKCKKMDIDVEAFINSGGSTYESIYKVTRDTAAKMIKKLTSFNNDDNKIDEKLIGYKEDWNKK
jgi:hypothetical protein